LDFGSDINHFGLFGPKIDEREDLRYHHLTGEVK